MHERAFAVVGGRGDGRWLRYDGIEDITVEVAIGPASHQLINRAHGQEVGERSASVKLRDGANELLWGTQPEFREFVETLVADVQRIWADRMRDMIATGEPAQHGSLRMDARGFLRRRGGNEQRLLWPHVAPLDVGEDARVPVRVAGTTRVWGSVHVQTPRARAFHAVARELRASFRPEPGEVIPPVANPVSRPLAAVAGLFTTLAGLALLAGLGWWVAARFGDAGTSKVWTVVLAIVPLIIAGGLIGNGIGVTRLRPMAAQTAFGFLVAGSVVALLVGVTGSWDLAADAPTFQLTGRSYVGFGATLLLTALAVLMRSPRVAVAEDAGQLGPAGGTAASG